MFSELVKLVPIIQENEEHKCKRFMAGLNFKIKVHLAWASQNNFGELVEAALNVERTISILTQGRPDSKRGAPGTSQPGTSQSSRKKGKKWTGGRGSGRGAASSQGSVRSPVALGGGRSSGSSSIVPYMSEAASRRVQDEHDRMFPLRAGRSLYPRLSTASSCRDL